jgi:hypothetical protein
MMGSAIDLSSLEATLNLFETLSGDWVGENRPFLLFQAFFFSPLHCEFWMERWAFFGLTETAKKENIYLPHAGKVLTHRQILKQIWGVAYLEQPHDLRVNISNLRHKLERDASRPCYILTEVGVDY